jgi:hypothetical protein
MHSALVRNNAILPAPLDTSQSDTVFEMGDVPEAVAHQMLPEYQLPGIPCSTTCVAVTPGYDVIRDALLTWNNKLCGNLFNRKF